MVCCAFAFLAKLDNAKATPVQQRTIQDGIVVVIGFKEKLNTSSVSVRFPK